MGKNNNLLASIAVFAELCNSEKDLRSILKEFVKSIFEFEKIYSVDVSQATNLLRKHFDFEFPEAVVKTCLNSLKNDGLLERSEGKYHKKVDEIKSNKFSEKLEFKRESQKDIVELLIRYQEKLLERKLDKGEKDELTREFIHYLIDNGVSENYSAIISSFVLKHSKSEEFVNELNQVKEGLVLVTGLRYTDDLGKIGSWNDELTFYLDTEHLFNSEGYNGKLYKKLFDDFFELINEVNVESRNKDGKDVIHLKYFEDVNDEIHAFFHVAEKIVQGKDNMSPENTAMEEICSGCHSVADVVRKKTEFETNLKTKGIKLCKNVPYLEETEYNIVDGNLLEKYSKDFSFEEDDVLSVLRSFTKINYLRKGKNRVRFEKCGHIILTGKYLTRQLSRDLEVKNEKKDIPYATDIYFVTNRFWYTLNKGFSRNNGIPASLDVVSKAQLALASLRNRSIEKKYSSLKKELSEGKINRKKAQEFYFGLREKAKKPEDITSEQIDESLDIIFDTDLEKYIREKSSLEEELKNKDDSIDELKAYKFQEERKKRRPLKTRAKIFYWTFMAFILLAYTALVILVGYFMYLTTDKTDFSNKIIETGLNLIPFIVGVIPILKYWTWLNKTGIRISKKLYIRLLNKLN